MSLFQHSFTHPNHFYYHTHPPVNKVHGRTGGFILMEEKTQLEKIIDKIEEIEWSIKDLREIVGGLVK